MGLHGGSALRAVMDNMTDEVRQESPGTIMFADDTVICSQSREQVETLERWRERNQSVEGRQNTCV